MRVFLQMLTIAIVCYGVITGKIPLNDPVFIPVLVELSKNDSEQDKNEKTDK